CHLTPARTTNGYLLPAPCAKQCPAESAAGTGTGGAGNGDGFPPPELAGRKTKLMKRRLQGVVPAAGCVPPGTTPPAGKGFAPHRIRLQSPPDEVASSSQGSPHWGTQFVLPGQAPLSEAHIPDPSPWLKRIISVGFASHAAGNSIEVRRMTTGADCDIVRNRR